MLSNNDLATIPPRLLSFIVSTCRNMLFALGFGGYWVVYILFAQHFSHLSEVMNDTNFLLRVLQVKRGDSRRKIFYKFVIPEIIVKKATELLNLSRPMQPPV